MFYSKNYNKFILNELQKQITATTDNLIEYLLMCLLLQNSTSKLNQWENEVYSNLNKTYLLRGKKKIPSEKVLYSMTLDQFSDELPVWIIVYIDHINYKENVNITHYNCSILVNYIIEYYQWLIPILAKNYFVTYKEVKDKIEILIKNYDKENNFWKRSSSK